MLENKLFRADAFDIISRALDFSITTVAMVRRNKIFHLFYYMGSVSHINHRFLNYESCANRADYHTLRVVLKRDVHWVDGIRELMIFIL